MLSLKKKEGIYVFFTNQSIPYWLWCLHDLVISLNKTSLLSPSVFLSETASNSRKTNES